MVKTYSLHTFKFDLIASMIKRIFKVLICISIGLCLIIVICNLIINSSTSEDTFDDIEEVPSNEVGIILGTSNKLKNGAPNQFYLHRISATVLLYQKGKIKFVLVSGDNGSKYYNEPETIKKDLVSRGVPENNIFLDYAGFRTLDSMVRAKEVFGLKTATIISQKFHNQRAIYLAKKKGLSAIGFNAKDVARNSGIKVQFREYFARVKVFIDLIVNTQPKFYGERVEIN